MKSALICTLSMVAILCAAEDLISESSPTIVPLVDYLHDHWQSPEEYVVGKFKTHDYVFIGEYHKIKQDILLIQRLIPKLYAAGIYNLGIEFGNHDLQPQIDSLITASEYDEARARQICFGHITWWGFKEYQDIYRAAWELNHSLPHGAPRFRVVALNYSPDFSKLTQEGGDEIWKEVLYRGEQDSYMAKIILEEFVATGKRALIYCGIHHAFTRYLQPIYDYSENKFIRFETNRTGNLIHDSLPNRTWTIALNYPWQSKTSPDQLVIPVMGIIDSVMMQFPDRRVGFDCVGTPFGELRDSLTYYGFGHDDFKLSDFCDGYIYQGNFCELDGCTPDSLFVTEDNLLKAIKGIATWKGQQNYKTVDDFNNTFRYYSSPSWLFHGLCGPDSQ